jgi:hypothetical protein
MKTVENLKKDFILYMEAILADIEFMEDAEEVVFPIYELVLEEEKYDSLVEEDELEELKKDTIYCIEKYFSALQTKEQVIKAISDMTNTPEESVENMFN